MMLRNALLRRLPNLVTFLALAAVASSASFAAGELRTWTDSTGKFEIKAKFVKLADGKVTLEQEDGSEIEIPLKKLSAADQKAASDAAKDSENPFKAKKAE